MAKRVQQQKKYRPDYDAFCNEEHLKYTTWYGKTYEAAMTISGSPDIECDLTHIHLPLPEEEEAVAATMFNLKREDVEGFNDWLWERVKRHVQNVRKLNQAETPGVIQIFKADVEKDDDDKTRDIYIFTPRYTPYHDTIKDNEISLVNVIGLGIRLGNIMRDVAAQDMAHGNICMDALFVDAEGKVVLGDFMYGDSVSEPKDENPYRYVLPPHVSEAAIVSGTRSPKEDVYACCSMLWNIIGEIPADERTPYRITPKKAPTEIVNDLRECMSLDNEDAIPTFRKRVSDMMRSQKYANSAIAFYVSSYRPRYTTEKVEPETATEEDLFHAIDELHRRTDA